MNTRHIIPTLFCALALSLRAAPVTFDELSLLVRMREGDASITRQVTERKLVRTLAPQQEATLKAQGASDPLLEALRNSQLALSDDEAALFDARRNQQKTASQQTIATLTPPPVPAKPTPPSSPTSTDNDARLGSGTDIIIERVVIQRHPIPAPYFVAITAKAGRAEQTFNEPKKAYGSGGINGSEIEIRPNLTLKNVQLDSWATITLQLDTNDETVNSYKALKKHTGRFQIFSGTHDNTFIPELYNIPFVYKVYWRTK